MEYWSNETLVSTFPTKNIVLPFSWGWKECLLSIPLGLIVLATILGNSLVLYSYITRSRTLRLPTHHLIANLALADFLVGILVMPFLTTLQLTGRWDYGSDYCESWTVIHFWLCAASIYSTCVICIERYIGVRYPLNHQYIMNANRIWGLILCVWILAGLLSFGSLHIWPQPKSKNPYQCDINLQKGHVITAVVGMLYIPTVIMIVLYFQIYRIATRHMRFTYKNSTLPATSSISSDNSRVILNGGFPIRYQSTSKVSCETSTEESVEESRLTSPLTSVSSANTAPSVTFTTPLKPTLATSTDSPRSNSSLVKYVQSRKQINLAKRITVLVAIVLVSYFPRFTMKMIKAFYPNSVDDRVFDAFRWIRYLNSCINPLIYAFAVPAYRKAMTNVVINAYGKIRCGQGWNDGKR